MYLLFAVDSWNEAKRDIQSRLDTINQLLVQATVMEFQHHETMLRILGERFLEVGAESYPEKGRVLIDQLLRQNPSMAGFGLALSNGQLILISGIPTDKKLPNLLHQSNSSASFNQAITSKKLVPGRTYFMTLLKRWLIPIRVAVINKNGDIPLVMTAGIDLDSKQAAWNALHLPDGYEIRLIREDGYLQFRKPLAQHSRNSLFKQPVADTLLAQLKTQSQADTEQNTNVLFNQDNFHLTASSYLPTQGLYTLVSIQKTQLHNIFFRRMLPTSMVFLMVIFASVSLFVIASRQQKNFEKNLQHQAHYDSVTHLPNRVLAMDRLSHGLDMAIRKQWCVALYYIDLDNFKRINDSYGHLVGDELLSQISERLLHISRLEDTVARLGGDEFLLIMPDLRTRKNADQIANRLLHIFNDPFHLTNHQVFSTASIGIAIYPKDGTNATDLMRNADSALYKAKAKGKNSFQFFSSKMSDEAAKRLELENELRFALERNELSVYYQPRVSIKDNKWIGAEALLRWNNAKYGAVSPIDFIPIAEESGLIHSIGRFVLETGLKDTNKIQSATNPEFLMSINLSGLQLQKGITQHIEDALTKYKIQPQHLELEVTESVLVESDDELHNIRKLGVHLAVDDFGTGFSSLGSLKRLPATTLKIDRSFIRDIETDPADAALTKAIISLGEALEMGVIAEGVETIGQLNFLRKHGCLVAQGYYYSRPIPLEDFLEEIKTQDVKSV